MSLMKPEPKLDDLMSSIRQSLGPASTTPMSLEQKLRSLPESELTLVLNTARMVKLIARMNVGPSKSYRQIVQGSYPNMRSNLQALIAEVLQDAGPLPDVPATSPQEPSATERVAQLYDSWDQSLQPTADDKSVSALETTLADVFSEKPKEKQIHLIRLDLLVCTKTKRHSSQRSHLPLKLQQLN